MAAGSLSPKFVCDKSCKHTDCAHTRKMAESPCFYCKKPIGYNTRFYREDSIDIYHALCLEKEIEKTTKCK